MNETGAGGSEGAKAGQGPAESDRVTTPRSSSAGNNNRTSRRNARPKLVLEHPDIPGPEFTIRRSFSIQDGITRFLEENVDTAWRNPNDLYVRAANAVWHMGFLKRRPSSVTAGRWIQQYTAVGEKYDFREVLGEGYWILALRGNGGVQEART